MSSFIFTQFRDTHILLNFSGGQKAGRFFLVLVHPQVTWSTSTCSKLWEVWELPGVPGKPTGRRRHHLQRTPKCNKKLKRKKSLGPDGMPNELFIEANETKRRTIFNTINKIHQDENIPNSSQAKKKNPAVFHYNIHPILSWCTPSAHLMLT